MIELQHVPIHSAKPRKQGITVVYDNGIALDQLQRELQTKSAYIDLVCIEPEALLSRENIHERIDLYKKHGVLPYMNGIVFEAAYIRKQLDEFITYLDYIGITAFEVSTGIVQISPDDYATIIATYSDKFSLIARIGARKNDYEFSSENWKMYIDAATLHGASYCIIEGSESGTSLVFNGAYDVKDSLVYTISQIPTSIPIIWEAPYNNQVVWFVTKFGTTVNLAKISIDTVLTLETMRVGMHASTFLQYLPQSVTKNTVRKIDVLYNYDWQI